MGRRGRVPAHAPPVLVLLRVPAKRGRVDYASTTAFYSSTGSPEDVPSTHATDGTAQQGGTIARCSFCGKVLYKLRVPIRPLHRLLQPPPLGNSLPYPLSILARVRARSTAPAGPSRAARRRHPSAASFSSDAPATSFQKYASVFWLSGVDASVAQPRSALLRRVATYRDCVSRDNPRATE